MKEKEIEKKAGGGLEKSFGNENREKRM